MNQLQIFILQCNRCLTYFNLKKEKKNTFWGCQQESVSYDCNGWIPVDSKIYHPSPSLKLFRDPPLHFQFLRLRRSPGSVLQCDVTSLTGVKDPWMDKWSEPSSLRERRALCWHLGNCVLFCPGLARCLHFEPETNANKGEERWREIHLWWHHNASLWLSPVSVVSPVASKITGKPLRTGSWFLFLAFPRLGSVFCLLY